MLQRTLYPAVAVCLLAMCFLNGCHCFRTDGDDDAKQTKDKKMNGSNPLMDSKASEAVFFPRPDDRYSIEAKGAFDHMFEVEPGVRLRLRLFIADRQAPVILFFHGNGETARDYDGIASYYLNLPASLAVAEYRGYGPSTGTPSFKTLLPDAHKTLDELKRLLISKGRSGHIAVMGRSLGSAPAIELAAGRQKELAGVIIESGFAYIVPLLELIGVPTQRMGIEEKHGPNNLAKMSKISLPTLIIHAVNDQIIPINDAEALVEAALDPKKDFLRVPNAGHNDIQSRAGTAYFERIKGLLQRIGSK